MTQQVLFDTDPGCDDAVMLAMALGHPDIEVVGLTTVCGNTVVENTTRNALSILELGDATDVPVARGCGRPLVGSLSTAEEIHGEGGIRGDLPTPTTGPVDAHAVEFMIDCAHQYGEDLAIAAVGPLTNLALALAQEPRLPELVGDIYVMGGNPLSPGNKTPAAEANFHNDPEAAARVLQDARVTLVGLNVTNDATVLPERIERYRASDGVLETVGDWLAYPDAVPEIYDRIGYAMHDAAVAADLLDSSVLTDETNYCEVDTSNGPSRGNVVCDVYGVTGEAATTDVAVDIDVERYRALLGEGVEQFADG
jgi:inosine-uridine nucleoside N-ribohydrolase